MSHRIVDSVAPLPTDLIIEIGPGTGALTEMLASRGGWVGAVELDRRLAEDLERKLARFGNVSIVWQDALAIDWDRLVGGLKVQLLALHPNVDEPRVRVVANLPYYISTAIIEKLLADRELIFDMTLMLQKEVAERITSGPGSRNYGYLSVLVQNYCTTSQLFKVPPSAFKPAPKVESALVRLKVRECPVMITGNEARLLSVVRACFAQRRKTILNNLKAAASQMNFSSPMDGALRAAGVEPKRRAETLSLAEFAALADALYT